MTQILDGKATSLAIEAELTEDVNSRLAKGLKRPHLAAILVGDNPASRAYVGHKVKACARVGFESTLVEKPTSITEDELLQTVQELNDNPDVDGFIVQLPSPTTLTTSACWRRCCLRRTWMASIRSTPGGWRWTFRAFCLPPPWASCPCLTELGSTPRASTL